MYTVASKSAAGGGGGGVPNPLVLPDMTSGLRKKLSFQELLYKKYISACSQVSRVPTRTGKPGKMGRHFPIREKSGNFGQTGKVRENYTKYWKNEKISDKYYLIF